jgi:antitoxin HigA-1
MMTASDLMRTKTKGARRKLYGELMAGVRAMKARREGRLTLRSHKSNRRNPSTPGEILREEFLTPLGMTQRRLADHLGCDVKVINRIVNGRSSVTAEMALKLAAAFRTTPEFWLNAQNAVDLNRAVRRLASLPRPLLRAG